jgi:hypothetical protein
MATEKEGAKQRSKGKKLVADEAMHERHVACSKTHETFINKNSYHKNTNDTFSGNKALLDDEIQAAMNIFQASQFLRFYSARLPVLQHDQIKQRLRT